MDFHSIDGYKLYTTHWLPDGDIRAVVIIAHGLTEYGERYQHVAAHLTQQGYAVYALDHYGHGHSDGRRCYFEDLDQPVRDLTQFVETIKSQHPDRPLFLYGHSMGALISLLFALDHQATLSGLILSGIPLHVYTLVPAFLVPVTAWLDRIVPALPIVPLGADGVSYDPATVARYKADPLIYHGSVRVRMSHFILAQSARARPRLNEIRLPLLALHGGDDPICPVSGSQHLYDAATSTDKTLKIYPDLYHEIHNEPEQQTILDDLATWLNDHSPKS